MSHRVDIFFFVTLTNKKAYIYMYICRTIVDLHQNVLNFHFHYCPIYICIYIYMYIYIYVYIYGIHHRRIL